MCTEPCECLPKNTGKGQNLALKRRLLIAHRELNLYLINCPTPLSALSQERTSLFKGVGFLLCISVLVDLEFLWVTMHITGFFLTLSSVLLSVLWLRSKLKASRKIHKPQCDKWHAVFDPANNKLLSSIQVKNPMFSVLILRFEMIELYILKERKALDNKEKT